MPGRVAVDGLRIANVLGNGSTCCEDWEPAGVADKGENDCCCDGVREAETT